MLNIIPRGLVLVRRIGVSYHYGAKGSFSTPEKCPAVPKGSFSAPEKCPAVPKGSFSALKKRPCGTKKHPRVTIELFNNFSLLNNFL